MKTILVLLALILIAIIVFSTLIYKLICVVEQLETRVDAICGQFMEVYDEVSDTLSIARENKTYLEDIIKDSNKKKNL